MTNLPALRIRDFSPNYMDSLVKCFNSIFDETEIPYFKSITDFSNTYIGLDLSNNVCAFIIAYKNQKGSAEYEIAYLGVSSEYRRCGYARALLQLIMDRLDGHCIWLNALADNDKACALYKDFGFKERERIIDNSGNKAIVFATVECLS